MDFRRRIFRKPIGLLQDELKLRKKYIFTESFVFPLELLLEAIGIYVILYYALKINTNISLGSIYLVLFYVKQCRSPLTEIFDSLEEMQTSLNSLKRIQRILKEEDDENILAGTEIDKLNGKIEFRNVCMDYGKEPVLQNLSFTIPKGSKVTIAGRTGVGKTSLTNALMRLYDICSGQILIDGHDISDISIKSLRSNISYISQNPYIFEDTLRSNITLGNVSISDDNILAILEKIDCMSFYYKFEQGLDEKVKESQLSLGELQIIAFVRAILHKANIYIFDEPTSNMDFKTEKLIQNLIDTISENSTVIIVAHRKSTLKTSDMILYLEDGKIARIIDKKEAYH